MIFSITKYVKIFMSVGHALGKMSFVCQIEIVESREIVVECFSFNEDEISPALKNVSSFLERRLVD